MLDRSKIIQEIDRVAPVLFKQQQSIPWLSAQMWHDITSHEKFLELVDKKQLPIAWNGPLGNIISIDAHQKPYSVCAVDGSQIYPDKHIEGVDCFLINAAGCILTYDHDA